MAENMHRSMDARDANLRLRGAVSLVKAGEC